MKEFCITMQTISHAENDVTDTGKQNSTGKYRYTNSMQIKKSKQPKIQQNKTTLGQSPLTTIGQEKGRAYSTTLPSPEPTRSDKNNNTVAQDYGNAKASSVTEKHPQGKLKNLSPTYQLVHRQFILKCRQHKNYIDAVHLGLHIKYKATALKLHNINYCTLTKDSSSRSLLLLKSWLEIIPNTAFWTKVHDDLADSGYFKPNTKEALKQISTASTTEVTS